jgi:hypothetical protein
MVNASNDGRDSSGHVSVKKIRKGGFGNGKKESVHAANG